MFQGAMVAIVTPFANGQVDEAGLKELIEFQIAGGTAAIIPCGTTGESATLSLEEHERVVAITVETVAKRIPVIAGTGSNNTEEAIRLTRHAKHVGADGALMISPYYNKPTQEGLYQHFKKVAESVDIPIVLYNIPGRTSVNMDVETIYRLSRVPNIVGIKEASGSMKQITDIIARCNSDFDVVSGEDFLTYPLICVGGKGVISVSSNILPADSCFMQAWSGGQVRGSTEALLPTPAHIACTVLRDQPGPGEGGPGHDGQNRQRRGTLASGDHVAGQPRAFAP
jgi:4-hydroxy-tetrahydrodipicolinate synthase